MSKVRLLEAIFGKRITSVIEIDELKADVKELKTRIKNIERIKNNGKNSSVQG